MAAAGGQGQPLAGRHGSWGHSRLLSPHGPAAAPTWHCHAHAAASAQAAQWPRPRRVPCRTHRSQGRAGSSAGEVVKSPAFILSWSVCPQDSQDKCCLSWKLISLLFLRNAFDVNEGLTGKLCIQITYLGNICLKCKASLSLQG